MAATGLTVRDRCPWNAYPFARDDEGDGKLTPDVVARGAVILTGVLPHPLGTRGRTPRETDEERRHNNSMPVEGSQTLCTSGSTVQPESEWTASHCVVKDKRASSR